MLILTGSAALNYHTQTREPKDIDVMGQYDEVMAYVKTQGEILLCYPNDATHWIIKTSKRIIEAELNMSNSVTLLTEALQKDPQTQYHDGFMIPSLDVLYMLKMSHRYKKNSSHFQKTMKDIQLMRSLGAKMPEGYEAFYQLREQETYHYNHPKLNVNKKDFFSGDQVPYRYEHDDIHEAVKHLDRPAYTYYKPDENEVFCSKEMFMSVDESIRLYGVLEEAYVLALERSQIPFGDKVAPKRSFDIALEKVCTSITSGWFREYAWENFDKVNALYDESYVSRFNQALVNNAVRNYGGTTQSQIPKKRKM